MDMDEGSILILPKILDIKDESFIFNCQSFFRIKKWVIKVSQVSNFLNSFWEFWPKKELFALYPFPFPPFLWECVSGTNAMFLLVH